MNASCARKIWLNSSHWYLIHYMENIHLLKISTTLNKLMKYCNKQFHQLTSIFKIITFMIMMNNFWRESIKLTNFLKKYKCWANTISFIVTFLFGTKSMSMLSWTSITTDLKMLIIKKSNLSWKNNREYL